MNPHSARLCRKVRRGLIDLSEALVGMGAGGWPRSHIPQALSPAVVQTDLLSMVVGSRDGETETTQTSEDPGSNVTKHHPCRQKKKKKKEKVTKPFQILPRLLYQVQGGGKYTGLDFLLSR